MSAGALLAGTPGTPTVVLVHGLASSFRVWDKVVPRLETSANIVAVQLESSSSIEADADDVAALLGPDAIVVGHSRGGLVATGLAERHPELVAALVLLCPPWSRESRLSARAPIERALAIPGLGDLLWVLASEDRQRAAQQNAFAPHVPVPDQFVADARSRGREDFVRSSRAIDTYLGARPLPERLGGLRMPVDLVFGELDARVARPVGHFDGLPRARVTELDGVGHTPPWEAPEVVATLIADYLPDTVESAAPAEET
ncbi:alpha/beta fold hydrolase [Nocardia caishijiensis]|uniref:Pimeloyl-ACP methyl ester carboxylesterase n=1 Tax=Nocardia caishijiensis TaxID=184756 RepID=A0ABQ6YHC7_9NOCA|nr:alpha/beta hydrolase [Nocardia caishijiensis]KAF0845204.1 pimeloyl-ACP methyl ester carboxylesterase [Nocardia caishijiensis]